MTKKREYSAKVERVGKKLIETADYLGMEPLELLEYIEALNPTPGSVHTIHSVALFEQPRSVEMHF